MPAFSRPSRKWASRQAVELGDQLWDIRWPKKPITAVACAPLPEKDVAQLADRYGVIIRDAICGPSMPAPDLARLEPG